MAKKRKQKTGQNAEKPINKIVSTTEEVAEILEKPGQKLEDFLADFGKIAEPTGRKAFLKKSEQNGKAVANGTRICAVCNAKGNFTINKRYKNHDYFFCNGSCEWMFIKDPENFEK